MQSRRQLVEGIVQIVGQQAVVAHSHEKDLHRRSPVIRPSPPVANGPQGALEGFVGIRNGILRLAGPVVGVRLEELVARAFEPRFAEISERRLHDFGMYQLRVDADYLALLVLVSFGASPESDPAEVGGGIWTGKLVGIDTRTRQRIRGSAAIGIDDFARPDVDIALTRITDSEGRTRADLRWNDIPVVHGAFRSRDMAGSVKGRFHGGEHREVGGIFERDRRLGAFGASR